MSHLYANIMNLPCYVPKCFFMAGGEALDAYKTGHRDARHAAADLANEADETIATLRAALKTHGEEAAKLLEANSELLDALKEARQTLDRKDAWADVDLIDAIITKHTTTKKETQ